jgi:hypothetical protein
VNVKTEADRVFEHYLRAHGRDDFLFDEPIAGTTRVPDYQLPWQPRPLLFEVKGFDVETPSGFGVVDPYPPLRKKINRASEQFRDLERYSCSLVLQYGGPGLIFLEPQFIFGAMLGEVGFEIPLDLNPGVLRDKGIKQVFTKKGRMIVYDKVGIAKNPQNTTINAIIVVEHYELGRRRFSKHVDDLETKLGHGLSFEELWDEIKKAEGTEWDVSLRVIRSVVHENPFARTPLPIDAFTGHCDERYGADGTGTIKRLFAGSTVAQLDKSQIEASDQ